MTSNFLPHLSPDPAAYRALKARLAAIMPAERLIDDPLRTLAYGTDASCYRLIPQLVAKVETESEVLAVLAAARALKTPVTFRAAGTSLSGQAVSDSVLMLLGDGWSRAVVEKNGEAIRLQPGVIGADANRRLAAFARKIGPDPASIDSAKIGGMAANNASGMCCGTADNSYQTLLSMRLVLADGTLVDTGDPDSVAAFRQSHAALLARLEAMGQEVRANPALAARIARKYAIKNTTGYALNALIDFTDPLDILQHLMIGSEGTLGFIAEITYRTVPDHAHKASALFFFPDIAEACRAVSILKAGAPVSAVELMDRPALRAVQDMPGMPDGIQALPPDATALLVETRATDAAALDANACAIMATLGGVVTLSSTAFTSDPAEYAKLWKIRKGLFPAVGAVRPTGTTVIIEDIAVPVPDLAAAMVELQGLFKTHGYHEAIIFGHALDGNVHFVFTQDFGHAAEVERYARFMDAVNHMVVETYDGSLKAEHGTGRNVAPYVEMEWGQDAYGLMVEIKRLLDPDGLLNPGVILNGDHQAHIKNLKALPAADPLVDTCIECGFCERMCPSHGLTLSPRQRIVGWREISRLGQTGDDPAREKDLRRVYDYQGLDTCAACGLCATACPVGIETGLLTKSLRGAGQGMLGRGVGGLMARHYGAAMSATRLGLAAVAAVQNLTGKLPGLPSNMPRAASFTPHAGGEGVKVVYIPSCAARAMGPSVLDSERESLPTVTERLLRKAGFAPVYPKDMGGLCCGQPMDSKGLAQEADAMARTLEQALFRASEGGTLPIVMDTSTCTARMKQVLAGRLPLFDVVEFLHDQVLPRLRIARQAAPVLLHVNCSARKMGMEGKMEAIARACAETVVVPEGVTCCGFAGDKGFTTPELNAHALRRLKDQVPSGCEAGYSSNRTCEIGLADKAGVPYRSIVYLLDRVSLPLD